MLKSVSFKTGAAAAAVLLAQNIQSNGRASSRDTNRSNDRRAIVPPSGSFRNSWLSNVTVSCDASTKDAIGLRSEPTFELFERLLFPRNEDFWSRGHDNNLLIHYDPSSRNPRWVLEHITSRGRHNVVAESRKTMHFHTDRVVAAAVETGNAPPASMVYIIYSWHTFRIIIL